MRPSPKPGILEISPYVGGRAAAPGVAKVFKLSSNESPLGPSPKALAALDEAKASLSLYPKAPAACCARRLVKFMAWTRRGSSPRAMAPTRCSPCWPTPICSRRRSDFQRTCFSGLQDRHPGQQRGAGDRAGKDHQPRHQGGCRQDAGGGDAHDAPGLYRQSQQSHRLVSQPDEIARLHAGLPKDVLLVIDAAYAEYVTAEIMIPA